jgi:transposase
MKQKNHASEDFKQQCVASYKHRGKRSLAEVALELGVGQSTLSKWVKDFNLKNEGQIVPIGDDAEKILRLQKENQQLKNENEFLKKISVYFAQEAPQPFKKQ